MYEERVRHQGGRQNPGVVLRLERQAEDDAHGEAPPEAAPLLGAPVCVHARDPRCHDGYVEAGEVGVEEYARHQREEHGRDHAGATAERARAE